MIYPHMSGLGAVANPCAIPFTDQSITTGWDCSKPTAGKSLPNLVFYNGSWHCTDGTLYENPGYALPDCCANPVTVVNGKTMSAQDAHALLLTGVQVDLSKSGTILCGQAVGSTDFVAAVASGAISASPSSSNTALYFGLGLLAIGLLVAVAA